jgi:hypothetical protein
MNSAGLFATEQGAADTEDGSRIKRPRKSNKVSSVKRIMAAITTVVMSLEPALDALRTNEFGTAREDNGICNRVETDSTLQILFECSERFAEALALRIAHLPILVSAHDRMTFVRISIGQKPLNRAYRRESVN